MEYISEVILFHRKVILLIELERKFTQAHLEGNAYSIQYSIFEEL